MDCAGAGADSGSARTVDSEEPVEQAELLESLGEFPGRSDQGDRMLAPTTKARARAFRHSE
jgi:hypothetical protein